MKAGLKKGNVYQGLTVPCLVFFSHLNDKYLTIITFFSFFSLSFFSLFLFLSVILFLFLLFLTSLFLCVFLSSGIFYLCVCMFIYSSCLIFLWLLTLWNIFPLILPSFPFSFCLSFVLSFDFIFLSLSICLLPAYLFLVPPLSSVISTFQACPICQTTIFVSCLAEWDNLLSIYSFRCSSASELFCNPSTKQEQNFPVHFKTKRWITIETWAGNTIWRGRISTIDLLALTGSYQLLLVLKSCFILQDKLW